MISNQSLWSELPFATLNDEMLRNNIVLSNNVDSHYDFLNLVFDPLLTEDDKYNNDIN